MAKQPGSADSTWPRLPLDDPAAYEIFFGDANTNGVFQVEKRGMKKRRCAAPSRPLRGHHRAGWLALYRPGPDGMVPDFILRKHGREGRLPHPT